MSIKHNRIKVSDLEKNQPNKILITNENGELEFSDFSNAATEFRKENFEFTGSKIFVLSQPAVNVLSVVVDGITLNGTSGAPLQYRMNSSTELEILDEMILEEDIWVSITYNYTGSINNSNGVQSVTGDGVDNTDPQNPVITGGAIIENQIVEGVTDKGVSQNAIFNALSLKADDSNVLHSTTNETFTGTKSANNSGSNVFNGMILNQVNGSGTPLRSTNSASGSAIELINNGTSQAAFIANYTSGTGVNVFNNGSGTGLLVNNNGPGNGVQINITGATNPNKKSLLITDNTDSNNGYLVSLEYGSGAAASLPFRVTRAGTTTYSITNAGVVTASSFKTSAGLSNQSLQADGSLFDLNSKVDKVVGKSLLADTEITRLAALSNYTHPANHPASIITQDSSNRFVTDAEKAIWNAKQASLGFVAENSANKNVVNGYAGLGPDGKLIASQLPSITLNDTFVTASQAAMLALSVQTGDIAIRTDLNKSFILKGTNPALLSDWQELLTPTSAVTTVFGRNGAVVQQTGDYTADQISETTTRKFQTANQQAFNDATSSIQTQLNSKQANIAAGTQNQYFRGDKTWQTLDKTAIGLSNVDNIADASKNVLSATKLTTPRTINGTAFDGSANITINAVDPTARIASSEKGAANGVATLDANGIIPTAQLPSYVDDVLEFVNLAGFPATGVTGKIYVAMDTNKTYRWGGSSYVYITSGAVDSVSGRTGMVTLTKNDVGLGAVDNTADTAKNVLSATKLTTARTINNVAFDGTANITITDSSKQATGATFFVGSTSIANNRASAAQTLTGVSIDGNAGTATTLQTARTINGVSFNGSANITINAVDATARIASSEKGAANGVATLDANGIIPTAQLPSYVDDVLEFVTLAGFPATGVTGKIYVAMDTNKTYRWGGSSYVYITSGAVDSVSGRTGVVTLTKNDVGLGAVDNTADTAKNVLSATKLTTARTINNVAFDGTANITITDSSKQATGATFFVGSTSIANNRASAAQTLTGVSIDGNAGTATTLQTARTINGVSFNGSANITINAVDATARIASSEKGAANGVATLDANGIIPTAQLPSYVDDVLEFVNLAGFPATGVTGKIYVAMDTNKTYRWGGSSYVYITSGAVDSVSGRTGVVTLTKNDVGLGAVDNTADTAKNVLSATKLTTARTINNVPFDGSANITITDSSKQATGATFFVGTTSIANNRASAAQTLTGVSIDGNAGTATTLQTARTINGVSFNGSANITIPINDTSKLPVTGGLMQGDIVFSGTDRSEGIFGTYDSTKTQSIWSMGTAYRNAADGSNFGTLYGLAYKYTPVGDMAGGHQAVWCQAGSAKVALGNGIWTSGGISSLSSISAATTISASQYFNTAAAPGNGYGFWGVHPGTYGILMSDAANSSYGGRISGETSSDYNMYFSMAQGTNRGFVFRNGTTTIASINADGLRTSSDIIAFSSSDERLKDNVKKIENPLEKLKAINGYTFDWNDKQSSYVGNDIGVIAQEIEKIMPQIVTTRENGFKAVKYEKIVPLLIEVCKEQQSQIDELKALVNKLIKA